ncbi:MAG: GDSL-type esterase/lipase family protein [Lentisphaeria bacterium]|jgi:lysophospholipase L1-like esterase|nr:GDSL-type esterase/lipase family protein [Lentisphaeria bacterium]NLZ59540.1 hypothetical protein [Lentisphaerota bacterium]
MTKAKVKALRVLGLVLALFRGGAVLAEEARQIELFVPERIYATPGVEMNVYFDNVSLLINSDNYVFDVNCAKGRNEARRWNFMPTEKDLGSHAWSLRVFDEKGLLAEAKSELVVGELKGEAKRELSILVIGDSLTNAGVYPGRILERCQANERLDLSMIGSKRNKESGMAHEGWGGWTWWSFIGGKDSKFLRFPDGDNARRGELDVQAYLDKYNEGKKPDVITLMLGINDIFWFTDEVHEEKNQGLLSHMAVFLSALRAAAPDALIGVALIPPPAGSQDAFGSSYACGQTRWQYRKNQWYYNRALLAALNADNPWGAIPVPVHINLDCLNNYPQKTVAVNQDNPATMSMLSNGVHPAAAGYKQIGDSFYSWMVNQLP